MLDGPKRAQIASVARSRRRGRSSAPPNSSMANRVTINTALMLFNLLPFFPLDGGRAIRGLLTMRWQPNRVTLWVTTAGMIGGGR